MTELVCRQFSPGYLVEANRNACGCILIMSVYIHGGCTLTVDMAAGSFTYDWDGERPRYLMDYHLEVAHKEDPSRPPLLVRNTTLLVPGGLLVDWLQEYILEHALSICSEQERNNVVFREAVVRQAHEQANELTALIKTAQFNPPADDDEDESPIMPSSDAWKN